MNLVDRLKSLIVYKNRQSLPEGEPYEVCSRCEANLTLQKGYSNEYPCWICKGCGEMLINPVIPDDVVWVCDGCGEMLNIQPGFSADCGYWKCTECGFENKIDSSEIYASEDEYQASLHNPYKGMTDADVLELMNYENIEHINGRPDIILVKNTLDENLYVKKILSTYDVGVYRYLKENPVANMPKLYGVFEGKNNLVIIEEYIEGKTLSDIIVEERIEPKKAVYIARCIAYILKELHGLEKPIIHRDIKPSNIMIDKNGEVYLLDVNVAKWFKSEETEDTRLLGTLYFASPEQFGYGFSSSSDKSDIYAIGILLNVMITGKLPKEEKAEGAIWNVIEKCICLEPNDRLSDHELISALDSILR